LTVSFYHLDGNCYTRFRQASRGAVERYKHHVCKILVGRGDMTLIELERGRKVLIDVLSQAPIRIE